MLNYQQRKTSCANVSQIKFIIPSIPSFKTDSEAGTDAHKREVDASVAGADHRTYPVEEAENAAV